jgi:hypothetical protein
MPINPTDDGWRPGGAPDGASLRVRDPGSSRPQADVAASLAAMASAAGAGSS